MPNDGLKVLYVVPPTKSFAGIERVTDSICEALARCYPTDMQVSVLYTSAFEQIADHHRTYRKIISVSTGRLDLMRRVRRTISQGRFDLVVVPQVEATALFWLSCVGLQRSFILHLHGNPRLEQRHWKARILFALMRLMVLPRLKSVFGTSPRQLEAFRKDYPSAVEHVWVPNPVRPFDIAARPPEDGTRPLRFVTVGRFAYQKGYDLLLRAFAVFRERRPGATLSLVGYGEEQAMITGLIDELALGDHVTIEHQPMSPAVPLSRSDVYLSASRWEGWSLAICEALRFGLPVISFDCEFGPSDIISDERLGRLVTMDDMAGFVDAMTYYADNIVEERKHADFRTSYIDQFDIDNVVHTHAEALFRAAGRDRRRTKADESEFAARFEAAAPLP